VQNQNPKVEKSPTLENLTSKFRKMDSSIENSIYVDQTSVGLLLAKENGITE